jgi:hypothetical protein
MTDPSNWLNPIHWHAAEDLWCLHNFCFQVHVKYSIGVANHHLITPKSDEVIINTFIVLMIHSGDPPLNHTRPCTLQWSYSSAQLDCKPMRTSLLESHLIHPFPSWFSIISSVPLRSCMLITVSDNFRWIFIIPQCLPNSTWLYPGELCNDETSTLSEYPKCLCYLCESISCNL